MSTCTYGAEGRSKARIQEKNLQLISLNTIMVLSTDVPLEPNPSAPHDGSTDRRPAEIEKPAELSTTSTASPRVKCYLYVGDQHLHSFPLNLGEKDVTAHEHPVV